MDYELMMNGNVRTGMKAPDFDAQTPALPICIVEVPGAWVIVPTITPILLNDISASIATTCASRL